MSAAAASGACVVAVSLSAAFAARVSRATDPKRVSIAPALDRLAFARVLFVAVTFALQLVVFALAPPVFAPVLTAPLTVPNTVAVTRAKSIAK